MNNTAVIPDNDKVSARTKWAYSVGCIGRDMNYTLVNTFILYFLTRGIGLSNWELAAITVVFIIARIWDAVNDPMMGTIVDNTRSKYGKFKPWIISGALINSIFLVLMFADFGLRGVPFIVVFGFVYIFWGMSYTMNDISYWSMYSSFSVNTKEREKVAALARIFANIGMFTIVAGAPLLYGVLGVKKGFFVLAVVIVAIFVACQLLVFFGVKEKPSPIINKVTSTNLKGMISAIFKNDQLMALVISMLMFTTGFYITTNLGVFFFEYDYGLYSHGVIDSGAFTIFAIILGVTQITALILYPFISKRLNRRQIFSISIVLVTAGYLLFFLFSYVLPEMWAYAIAGVMVFAAQAFLQLLILVMLANTVEYGQWKSGKRNEGVLFSLNPFITKLGSAIQIGINSLVLGISGINAVSNYIAKTYEAQADSLGNFTKEIYEMISRDPNVSGGINSTSVLWLRLFMFILPLALIIGSYIVFMTKYKLDEKMYDGIIADLKAGAAGTETGTGKQTGEEVREMPVAVEENAGGNKSGMADNSVNERVVPYDSSGAIKEDRANNAAKAGEDGAGANEPENKNNDNN